MKRNKSKDLESKESFIKFLLRKDNKVQLLIFFLFYCLLYVILVYLYPYPASISDSGAYVKAALNNRIDTFRPFGYSKFLIILHGWSESIHFLVLIQYLISALSTLFFIFSVKFLFQPKKKILYYLFCFFAIFSPMILYLADSALSDSLFTSLTVLWLATGFWLLYSDKLSNKIILSFIHIILLITLINIRYTGLIYLPVTLLFIYFSLYRRNKLLSVVIMILPLLLVYAYYSRQKSTIKKLVQVNTFSGFNGWQLANNALNCVPFIRIYPSEFKDPEVRNFAEFVIRNDSLLKIKVRPSAKFMWDAELPLKKYHRSEMTRQNKIYLYEWNYLGENVYSKFGAHIIKKHPLAFARHFMLPNLRLVLYPTQDQIVKYFRTDGIPTDLLKTWFGFGETEKLYSRSRIFEKTFFLIPFSRLIIWALLFAVLLIFFTKRKHVLWQPSQKAIFLISVFFLAIYSAFSVYAGPFELRYIAPIHLVQIALIFIMLNMTLFNNVNAADRQK
jgi:hypothetical protein